MNRRLSSDITLNKDQDQSLHNIMSQLQTLDRQNQKLISIADSIMKTSFLRPTQQTPTIILQYQQDMKTSFNVLIQSIREFFINIQHKIRTLGIAVQRKITQHEPMMKRSNVHQGDKLDQLIARMGMLQSNIRKAQDNQLKLMTIVQGMALRNNCDQQPTMVRDEKTLQHDRRQPQLRMQQSRHENSFRLFSVGQSSMSMSQRQFQKHYGQYNMVDSNSQQMFAKATKKNSFGCLPKRQEIIYTGYNSLKKKGRDDGSGRNHRLTTLMQALKE